MLLPLHYSALYQAGNRTSGPWAEPSETVGHGLSPLRQWAKIPFLSFQFFRSGILSQQEKANSAVFWFLGFFPLNTFLLLSLLGSHIYPQSLQPHFCDVCVIVQPVMKEQRNLLFFNPFPNTH